jgi:hypothetical protein
VQKLLETYNEDFLHAKDKNQWQAIHEAAKGGHTEVQCTVRQCKSLKVRRRDVYYYGT